MILVKKIIELLDSKTINQILIEFVNLLSIVYKKVHNNQTLSDKMIIIGNHRLFDTFEYKISNYRLIFSLVKNIINPIKKFLTIL